MNEITTYPWPCDFEPFSKIARLSREIIVTEKIDGTNALVYVDSLGGVHAGSRTRWITLEADNYGFAAWVKKHEAELRQLGPGRHFGEWWGSGIQRGYGLQERRFSLFNTQRWHDTDFVSETRQQSPACCRVVPVLYAGPFSTAAVEDALAALQKSGSVAAFGFMRPEGVVVYHTAARILFKKTLEKDEAPKTLA